MISRVWHGWTTHENADSYEALLRSEIFPGIRAKGIEGFRRIELFRRAHETEVEFVTVMWFDDIDAVRAFAGDDHEASYVPPKAREVLSRYDDRSRHYEVREAQSG